MNRLVRTTSVNGHPVTEPAGPPRAGGREGRPLRIAMVVPPYFDVPPKAYGGVEAVVASLSDGLVERGHEVTLICAGRADTRRRE